MKNELLLIIQDSKYKEEDKFIINEKLLLEKLIDYINILNKNSFDVGYEVCQQKESYKYIPTKIDDFDAGF